MLLLQVFVNNVNKIVRTRTCQGNLLIINYPTRWSILNYQATVCASVRSANVNDNKAFVGRDRQLPEKYKEKSH